MRIIELDAAAWKTVHDFYDAILAAIGAPAWHGRNVNALIDSIVWGGINTLEPPYKIRICNVACLPKDVIDHIELSKHAIAKQREEFLKLRGRSVEVELEVAL